MRWLVRSIVALLVLVVGGFLACRLLVPDGYAVNAPMLNSMFGWGIDPPAELLEERLQVAPGFTIQPYARVERARMLKPTAAGGLLVSVPREGKIVLIEPDADGDGLPDGQRDLLTGLDRPHGIDLSDGWLYIGEGAAVARIRFDAATGTTAGELERIVEGLPEGGNHWTKTVRIGPDGGLYVSVGSSCNVCVEEDERRAAMLRFEADGSRGKIHAIGLRNAVGFDWHPGTGALYATDNGRDLLGDDFPPCELNEVVEGGDYGWPFANGDRVIDPDLGAGHEARVQASRPPAFPFPAHNAPLGIAFLRHDAQPEAYRNAALTALHGSWNRSRKDGYKVVSLHWDDGGAITSRDFIWGFEKDEDVIGRPVDVAEGPDGSIYVSDDYAGLIFRVRTDGARPAQATRMTETSAVEDPLAGLPTEEIRRRDERGAVLYEEHACASCHDAARAAEGVVPVPLAGTAATYDVEALTAFFLAPTPPMPAFPLSPDERQDLAVHVLSTFP
jgi:glucose/arabinose dehydrogenase